MPNFDPMIKAEDEWRAFPDAPPLRGVYYSRLPIKAKLGDVCLLGKFSALDFDRPSGSEADPSIWGELKGWVLVEKSSGNIVAQSQPLKGAEN
jgi:hypothetical protein